MGMGSTNEANGKFQEQVALRHKLLVGRAEPGEALRELVGAQRGRPFAIVPARPAERGARGATMESTESTGAGPHEQPLENCGVADVRRMANAPGHDHVHGGQHEAACCLQRGGDARGAAEHLEEERRQAGRRQRRTVPPGYGGRLRRGKSDGRRR